MIDFVIFSPIKNLYKDFVEKFSSWRMLEFLLTLAISFATWFVVGLIIQDEKVLYLESSTGDRVAL